MKAVGNYFVKIRATTWERLRDLQQVYDLDVFSRTAKRLETGEFEIEGLLSDEQMARARADGYAVEIATDAEETARARLKEIARRAAEPDQDRGGQ
jgi:hypothetical protein